LISPAEDPPIPLALAVSDFQPDQGRVRVHKVNVAVGVPTDQCGSRQKMQGFVVSDF